MQENTLAGGLNKNQNNIRVEREEEIAKEALRDQLRVKEAASRAKTVASDIWGQLTTDPFTRVYDAVTKLTGSELSGDVEKEIERDVEQQVNLLIQSNGSARAALQKRKNNDELPFYAQGAKLLGQFGQGAIVDVIGSVYGTAGVVESAFRRNILGDKTVEADKSTVGGVMARAQREAFERGWGENDGTLTANIFRGGGQMLGQIALSLFGAGILGKGAGTVGMSPRVAYGYNSALGVSQVLNEAYETARRSGATEDQAQLAALFASPSGLLEGITEAKVFAKLNNIKKLDAATGGGFSKQIVAKFKSVAKEAIKGGITEYALEEVPQQLWATTAGRLAYKQDSVSFRNFLKDFDASLRDSTAALFWGGIIGGGTGIISNPNQGEASENSRESLAVEDAPISPQQSETQQTRIAESEIQSAPEVESQANIETSIVGKTVNLKNKGQGVVVEDRGSKVLVDYNNGQSRAEFPKKQIEFIKEPEAKAAPVEVVQDSAAEDDDRQMRELGMLRDKSEMSGKEGEQDSVVLTPTEEKPDLPSNKIDPQTPAIGEISEAKTDLPANEKLPKRKTRGFADFRAEFNLQTSKKSEAVETAQALKQTPFYSAVEKNISEKMPNRASVGQVRAILNNGAVKQAETDAIGIDEFLDGKDTVTKDEVLNYVKANQIEVEEVVKGEVSEKQRKKFAAELESKGYKIEYDEKGEPYGLEDADGYFYGQAEIDELPDKAAEVFSNLTNQGFGIGDAKFSTVQLGGQKENYREIFVTAPKFNESWADGHQEFSDIKNPIVRLRTADRIDTSGAKVFTIEEFQPPKKDNFSRMPKVLQKYAYSIGIKNALRLAVEGDYNKIVWTTGKQQTERSNLRNYIETVQYRKEGGKFAVKTFNNDNQVIEDGIFTAKELETDFGKTVTSKIIRNAAPEIKTLSNDDLRESGKGLKNLYDSIIPNLFNRILKKFGARVGQTEINTGERAEAVHSVELTPELKKEIAKGLPLFRKMTDGDLTDVAAAMEMPTVELLKKLQWTPQAVTGKIKGEGIVEIDTHDHEFIRRLWEDDSLRKGEKESENPFNGVFLVPSETRKVIGLIDDFVKELKGAKVDNAVTETIETFRAVLKSESAKMEDTALIYIFDEALPEELFHQTAYLEQNKPAAEERLLENQISPEAVKEISESKVFEKYIANDIGKAYADKPLFIQVHEFIAKLATGQATSLGFTETDNGAITEIQQAWATSYWEQNPDASIERFERINEYAATITETAREITGANQKRNVSDGGIAANNRPETRSDERATERGNSANESSPPDGSQIEKQAPPAKVKERRTVLSAEKTGLTEKGAITGEARYYTEKSRVETTRKAQERIERDGLAQAVADALNPNAEATPEHAAHQIETIKLLNRQADEATKAGNPVIAQAKLNQSLEIMLPLALEGTTAGQFISQLASMGKTDPDTVAGYVQKRRAQKGYDEALTPEQSQVLRETAEKLQAANVEVETLENRIAELEKQLSEEGEKKESVKTSKGKTKPLSSVEKTILEGLQSKAEEAAARLKNKFRSSQVLKMASPIKSPIIGSKIEKLDAETLRDLSTVGAEMLLTGLKANPVSVVDFKKSLLDIFGGGVRPHLSEIHALSVKELQRIKSEAYRARAVETLRDIKGNEDLTLEDLSAIVEKQTEERKAKTKTRTEHKTEADKFFNADKIADKERAKEAKEQAKADLPSFAKSLFKVAATENKEVLLGAFYLETGQVANADELARRLRESFPNLSAREALNASSLAARARNLAHKDLQAERAILKAEKRKTETEAAEVRTQRNEAQRILLRRVASLEKPPLGYISRAATVYKAALVSAVQTTVNNILTAEGTRKIVALTDLTEVAINKALAAVGREYDYKDKLGSETRIDNIFGLSAGENDSVADVAKSFFTDAVFARGIANSVLDEYPTFYEAMFGSYASDVEIMKERTGADNIADKAVQAVEKTYNAANFLNQFQEFLIRSQEFNYALQLKLGQKGLNLADVVKNKQIVEKISENDLTYAVNRALRVTFALKPDTDTNFGKLANLYQSATPSIVSPFLVTFPNFLYNATKFVTDYAPAVGLVKAGLKIASNKNNALGQSVKEELNPRVISQQLVGTALFLAALGLVRAAGDDDDKWYYLKTPFTDDKSKNYYIDVRGYQPFASMIFLANKANRAIDGKPIFTDRDTAVAETLEALTGLSTRNLSENKIASILWRSTLGREGDDKDWERVAYLAKQQLGEISGGFLRPLKTVKDLVAQFNEYEAKMPDTIDRPGSQGIVRSLPFANHLLGLEPRKDFVTGEESSQAAPGLKIFGVSVVNPDFHKEVPSKALVAMREMTDNFKSEKDVLPEAQRKSQIKGDFYRAMKTAGDDKEKQAKIEKELKRAEANGFLEAGEIEFIERKKGLTELENLSKRAKYEQIGRAYAVATDSEKLALESIVQTKATGANKRRDLTAKDVETIRKYLSDFQIDLNPPLTIYEKVKSATTDEAVEIYLDKQSELTDKQKDDFKSFIKQKAENANRAGKLTDAEIENIKKIVPDLQILKKLPSQFEPLPSEFEQKFDSLKVDVKDPQNKTRSFAAPSKKRGFTYEDIDPRFELPVDTGWGYGSITDSVINKAGAAPTKLKTYRQSENIEDRRPGAESVVGQSLREVGEWMRPWERIKPPTAEDSPELREAKERAKREYEEVLRLEREKAETSVTVESQEKLIKNADDAQSVIEIFENAEREQQPALLQILRRKAFKTASKKERLKYKEAIKRYLNEVEGAAELERQGVRVS